MLNHQLCETFGPWGNSPEEITSWFDEGTDLRDICRGILIGNPLVINRINSIGYTLGYDTLIRAEYVKKDLKEFLFMLQSPQSKFFLLFQEHIFSKLDPKETFAARNFLENIILGIDNPAKIQNEIHISVKYFLSTPKNTQEKVSILIDDITKGNIDYKKQVYFLTHLARIIGLI